MYLRFVVAQVDEDSECALGVFHAVWNLRDAGKLHSYEEEQHDIVRWWFSTNLERPNALYGSQSAFLSKKEPWIVLVQDTANEHIVQIRELIAILENHEVYVKTLKTKRAGYVVYEDEYQIVAEPFADMNS